MGDVQRKLMVLLALLACAALPAQAPAAPSKQAEAGAPSKEALAKQAFEAAMKAYGAGKYDEAQRAFEAAITNGLESQQMSRLLYYRGLTYRKQHKPGMAISDLNGALWLKGGLSDAERQDAIKARALAYNESGISDVPPVPQSSFAQAPSLPGKSEAAASVQTAMADPGGTSVQIQAPAAPAPQSSSGGGVTGFFSDLFSGSLFGGGSSTPSSAPPPGEVTTASIGNSAPPYAGASDGWGGTTQVSAATSGASGTAEVASPFVTQVATADPAPRTSAARSSAAGGFRLQVASVRSRSEAEALAGLVVGRHAQHLGGRQPEVDEAVVGSMGTFYRVRLGPYSSAQEPEKLCGALRADGFDCLVVTQ